MYAYIHIYTYTPQRGTAAHPHRQEFAKNLALAPPPPTGVRVYTYVYTWRAY